MKRKIVFLLWMLSPVFVFAQAGRRGAARRRPPQAERLCGEWFEIGEMSQDGENWNQFFEMTLRHID